MHLNWNIQKKLENLTTYNTSSRIIPKLEEWCSCGQYEVMPTAKKCVCCQHCDYTVANL